MIASGLGLEEVFRKGDIEGGVTKDGKGSVKPRDQQPAKTTGVE